MTQDGASEGLTMIDEAIEITSGIRAKLGAYQNRMEHAIANLDVASQNLTEALSRIEDADMAAALRQAGPLLGHMHVPDSNRAAPGMGHIDYRPILEALRDIGYDGYLSSEAMPVGDSDGCALRGAATLDALLG